MHAISTHIAPTFFTPIPWQGGLYGDGALVANNPTAIALQEAKVSDVLRFYVSLYHLMMLTDVFPFQ